MARPRTVQTSGARAPKAPAMPPIAPTADLLERFKDYPAIDLISRQLENPGDPGSLPILLKDESPDACVNTDHQWRLKPGATTCHLCGRPARLHAVRFVNTAQEGRWSSIKARGYVPVEVSELRDTNEIADLVKGTADRYVRRGDSGKEVLVKRPLEIHNAIKAREREQRDTTFRSKRAMRESLAEQAGASLGDQAGQTIYEGGIKVESLKRTKGTLAGEFEAADDDA